MPPKRGGPPRRGGRGNHSSNEQSRDTPSDPSQRGSASSSPTSFYGQPDDTPDSDLLVPDQQVGAGWDAEDAGEVAHWNRLRRRDHPEVVDTTEAGAASSAGNAQDPAVQASDIVGEDDEVPELFGDRVHHGSPELDPEQRPIQSLGSTNVAQTAGISNTQNPQPAQSNSDQISNIQDAREEAPARGPPPPPFNTPEAPLQITHGESSSPTPASASRASPLKASAEPTSASSPSPSRASLHDPGTTPGTLVQSSQDSSDSTSSSEANPYARSDAPMIPGQPKYGPHISRYGYPTLSEMHSTAIDTASASQVAAISTSHGAPEADETTPPGAANPDTTTPPAAPEAGDGPRYGGTERGGSPVRRGSRAPVDAGSNNSAQADSAQPAHGSGDDTGVLHDPDVPRPSVERDTEADDHGDFGETPGGAEDLYEEEEVIEEAVEDPEATNRRKRSDHPELSSPEDDADGVNGEPPRKRRKDNKDDDRNGHLGSTPAVGSVPQFDGSYDYENDFPTLQESNSRYFQQQTPRTIQFPGEQRQYGNQKTKRREILKYRADREDYTSMRPKRELVSRIATPELDEESFLGTKREDHMGEGGSKKGKMQGYDTKFDRDWNGHQKDAGGQKPKKQ